MYVIDEVEQAIRVAVRSGRAAWLPVRWLRKHRSELAAVAALVMTLVPLLL